MAMATTENELSTGLAINSPADDPSGYIEAQGFTSQINGLDQANSNSNQALSLLQTAQGGITQQSDILQSLNSLAVQAANGTQTSAERGSLQQVASQLLSQIDTISSQTQFNGINLLDGSVKGMQLQTGANDGQTTSLSIGSTNTSAIGMYTSKVNPGQFYGSYGAVDSLPYNHTLYQFSGTIGVTNGAGQTATATVQAGDTAAQIASSINQSISSTGITAEAITKARFFTKEVNPGSGYAFQISADTGSGTKGNPITVDASSLTQMLSQINENTVTTGLSASVDSKGFVTFAQSSGQNIDISNITSGYFFTTNASSNTGGGSHVGIWGPVGSVEETTSTVIQGQIQFQSASAFSLTNGNLLSLNDQSTLHSLSSINLAKSSSAAQAINIIKYATQKLGLSGADLGAQQQSIEASITNLGTEITNQTTALGVVQDANIPQTTNTLTEEQIQAQSGVAALKQSSQLQQSFLSLLP